MSRRGPFAVALLGGLLALGACESAEERCTRGRAEARVAWERYVDALTTAREQAEQTHERAQTKISGEIQRRLSPAAQAAADAHYDRHTDAWTRAFESNLAKACDEEPECSRLQEQSIEARTLLRDFRDRVPAARAALEAVDGPLGIAEHRGKAVPAHPDYPQLAAAREATVRARELCADD
ncbi:MAG: hypothetical protein PVI30_12580 [Myxococcales bacterium]